jgi:hypothetical protein
MAVISIQGITGYLALTRVAALYLALLAALVGEPLLQVMRGGCGMAVACGRWALQT